MVTVRVPATTANLGSGFDVFGAALETPADVMTLRKADETSIEMHGAGSEFIPTEPSENTAGVVAEALDTPAEMRIDKGIRPASGLGSSAASAAGAAIGLNELYDLGLSERDLIPYAAEGEALVSGDAHLDNVAPAILGGFTIATEEAVTDIRTRLPVVACLPDLVVSTRDARDVVPASTGIPDLVDTVGRAATLTVGMCREDPVLVGQGMEDHVITPRRSALIEGYEAVRERALANGATGVTVSGAGPTVLAACRADDQRAIAIDMVEAFNDAGVDARAYQTRVGRGATVHPDPVEPADK